MPPILKLIRRGHRFEKSFAGETTLAATFTFSVVDETAARNIGRQQAARLAAILPAPLKRRPERMNSYSAVILRRMRQVNW